MDFIAINKEDSVIYDVAAKMRQRADKGKLIYNATMDRKDLTLEQWLDHAIEEALDLAIYLTKIKKEHKMDVDIMINAFYIGRNTDVSYEDFVSILKQNI